MHKGIVVHMTSVHARHDTRIFLKECSSLAKAGYRVYLIVADGQGDEIRDEVSILDVGRTGGRFSRMLRTTRKVFRKAKTINADVYHIHDPELVPVALRLRSHGKHVIFDSHEDFPKQLLSKPYLSPAARRVLSFVAARYERWAAARFDGIIAATPHICKKFSTLNHRSETINNFPILNELATEPSEAPPRLGHICYVGGITRIRGVHQVVTALSLVDGDVRLQLAGSFAEREIEEEAKRLLGWGRVDFLGYLDRAGVRDVLSRSVAGVVTFHPSPNHIAAQPNKMFEYMSAGIPVIASNFPLWREIVEGNDCGLCVDPMDPAEIASAIEFLINNPRRARDMGENGRKAVMDRYNWSVEERKLLDLYLRLIK